jgi:hypothetical protein
MGNENTHYRWVSLDEYRDTWTWVDNGTGGGTWSGSRLTEDEIMEIIETKTKGKFYFNEYGVAFEKEQDAIMFKLAYNG